VPQFVARQWREICERAADEGDAEEGPTLGAVRITAGGGAPGAAAAPRFELALSHPATAGLPQEYALRAGARDAPATLAFSDNAGRFAAEGVVAQRFDAEPAGRGAAGAPALDAAYRKLSRERGAAAAVKTRAVRLVADPLIVNIRRPVGARDAPPRRRTNDDKRVAMEATELQAALFRLFERQPRWVFAQLQRETEQPTAHLKAVLAEVAAQNKRGPYRDLWELRAELRTGAGAR
jgi:hypothetical protein